MNKKCDDNNCIVRKNNDMGLKHFEISDIFNLQYENSIIW